MDEHLDVSEIPMGLNMAMAKNLDAMTYFTNLSKDKQRQIVDYTHNIKSKKEMRAFVDSQFEIK